VTEHSHGSPVLDAIRDNAKTRPGAVVLRFKRLGRWQEVSAASLASQVATYTAAMRAAGITPGADVVVLGDNSIEWVYADLALQALGARSAPLPASAPDELVRRVVAERADARVIAARHEDVRTCDALGIPNVLVLDPRGVRRDPGAGVVVLPPIGEDSGATLEPAEPAEWSEVDDDGVAITVRLPELSSGLKTLQSQMTLSSRDRTVVVSPLFDLTARIAEVYAPLVAGAVVHVPETAESVPEDFAEVRPTVLAADARVIEALHLRSQREYLRSGRLSRWTIDWGFNSYASASRSARWSLRRLVTHGVAVQHGFDALRLVLVTGHHPTSASIRFFEALGAEVCVGEGAGKATAVEALVRESPYVKRAILSEGDGNRITLELHGDLVSAWARRQGVDHPNLASLCRSPEIRALVAGDAIVGAVEQEFGVSAPDFRILPGALRAEHGELTIRGFATADASRQRPDGARGTRADPDASVPKPVGERIV